MGQVSSLGEPYKKRSSLQLFFLRGTLSFALGLRARLTMTREKARTKGNCYWNIAKALPSERRGYSASNILFIFIRSSRDGFTGANKIFSAK